VTTKKVKDEMLDVSVISYTCCSLSAFQCPAFIYSTLVSFLKI